jgi:enoyl-CoA hydratase/carnithine racemase
MTVRLDVDEAVAIVTIDSPPVNSLGNATLRQLGEIARTVALDREIRAVVLTGAGTKAFAAGADLGELKLAAGDSAWIEQHTALTGEVFATWEHLPQPTVAALQASAVGGGLELALVCDFVVTDPRAKLGTPEVTLGLMPGAGATQRLPQLIGHRAARELLLLGHLIDAGEAHRLGLVNTIVEPGTAVAAATALAGRLAALPALAVQSIKRVMLEGRGLDLSAGLARERELFRALFVSDDFREGVDAFTEKRPPNFAHR